MPSFIPRMSKPAGSGAGSAALGGEPTYVRARKVAAKIAACLNRDFRLVSMSAVAVASAAIRFIRLRLDCETGGGQFRWPCHIGVIPASVRVRVAGAITWPEPK